MTTSTFRPTSPQSLAALFLYALLISAAFLINRNGEQPLLAFSLVAGGLFGFVLQRSRFCFFCVSREFIQERKAQGVLGLVVALAVGTLGYHAVFGSFMPDPSSGRLPPDAHIGPVSWVLALGATSFGIGMAISGSCISAHLYRLGEGSLASPFALLGALIGFGLGFASWNFLYLRAIQEAPVPWLPALLGYGGSVLLQLAALAALAWYLIRRDQTPAADNSHKTLGERLFVERWPAYVGGILVGALGIVAYFRVAPLGVTAELGSIARTTAAGWGLLPERLEGLDTFRGCATAVKETLLSNNGLFILGLVIAAWASALMANAFKPTRPTLSAISRNFIGGILLGWGGMVSLGCTVGVLLSGIMAGALAGWVFGLFCLIGMLIGLQARKLWPN